MTIFLPCLILMLLQGKQNNSDADNCSISFAAINARFIPTDTSSASVIYFNGITKKERVLLNWIIDKNQEADRFEVERSLDGKKFVMAALVFGTDQPEKVKYLFFEKKRKVKVYYRLKIIQKDLSVDYSPVISPEPFL